jgi:hypothetical protein
MRQSSHYFHLTYSINPVVIHMICIQKIFGYCKMRYWQCLLWLTSLPLDYYQERRRLLCHILTNKQFTHISIQSNCIFCDNSIIVHDRLKKFWAVDHILNLAALRSLKPQTMVLWVSYILLLFFTQFKIFVDAIIYKLLLCRVWGPTQISSTYH